MAVTQVAHFYDVEGAPPSQLRIDFDRELTEREASEVAQAVAGIHERHEAARAFDTNPHHRRHLSRRYLATVATEQPDVDADGAPIIHPASGQPTVTRTFSGSCKDCGRAYVRGTEEPQHYVCPSLPPENTPYLRFRVVPCHPDCAIDCGRDATGQPVRAVEG